MEGTEGTIWTLLLRSRHLLVCFNHLFFGEVKFSKELLHCLEVLAPLVSDSCVKPIGISYVLTERSYGLVSCGAFREIGEFLFGELQVYFEIELVGELNI